MEPKPTYTISTLPDSEIYERWWLAFTPDHNPTAAAERFVERTGQTPTYLVKTPTMLLVGPLSGAVGQRTPAVEIPAPIVVQATPF